MREMYKVRYKKRKSVVGLAITMFALLLFCIALCLAYTAYRENVGVKIHSIYTGGANPQLVEDDYNYNSVMPGNTIYYTISNENFIRAFAKFNISFEFKKDANPSDAEKEYLNEINSQIEITCVNTNLTLKSKNGFYYFVDDENEGVYALQKNQTVRIAVHFPETMENRLGLVPTIVLQSSIYTTLFGKNLIN